MKKLMVMGLVLLFTVSGFSHIEKGDTEVSFLGYFTTRVGEDVDPNGAGAIQLSYGKYVTPFFIWGVAPVLTFYTFENWETDETELKTDWSGSVFFNLNLSTTAKTFPYITGRYYQFTFDIPDDQDFSDYSYVTIGLGIKSFFNEYAALNILGTYGFSLAEEAEGGIVNLMTGITFLF